MVANKLSKFPIKLDHLHQALIFPHFLDQDYVIFPYLSRWQFEYH